MIKGCKEKFFFFLPKDHFLPKNFFSLMKTSDIFVENLVNKKLLLAAFYHLTYQHDSKDFNICNYKKSESTIFFFTTDLSGGGFIPIRGFLLHYGGGRCLLGGGCLRLGGHFGVVLVAGHEIGRSVFVGPPVLVQQPV